MLTHVINNLHGQFWHDRQDNLFSLDLLRQPLHLLLKRAQEEHDPGLPVEGRNTAFSFHNDLRYLLFFKDSQRRLTLPVGE
jgi:hypothetical protein